MYKKWIIRENDGRSKCQEVQGVTSQGPAPDVALSCPVPDYEKFKKG